MRQTNLESIKHTAIVFLHMPIELIDGVPKELSVYHPIYESSIQFTGKEILDVYDNDKAREESDKRVSKVIQDCDTVNKVFYIIRKSYRMTFLKYVEDDLSLEDFSRLLEYVWTVSENPNQDANCSLSLIKKWFRKADKQILMSKEDYEYYQKLPEVITVYRGVSRGRNPKGLSWTDDYNKAEWFANRFGEGYILSGTVKKKYVFAYLNGRDEKELVCDSKYVEICKM